LPRKLLIVAGTRPEIIKLASLVRLAQADKAFEVRVCVTAQHRDLLDPLLDLFGIVPDFDLNVMEPGQDLYNLSTKILHGMKGLFANYRPDVTIVQGDTTTAMMAGLASFYEKIDVGHVEAGLRTGNLYSPWPEEGNRKLLSAIARYHYAPTAKSRQNLLNEGVPDSNILMTGNTVIDALVMVRDKIAASPALRNDLAAQFGFLDDRRMVLITAHRRENFGDAMERFCTALGRLAAERTDVQLVYPVHPNPNVRGPVHDRLSKFDNIHLIDPATYLPFVYLMSRAHLIITDSGGIQEEAPSLGKPVLVARDTTERAEAVEAGTAIMVGTDIDRILGGVYSLLDDQAAYMRMAQARNPFGDGTAAAQILEGLKQ
jgi:UDP-N-acetylglucosamine 2-epimerase